MSLQESIKRLRYTFVNKNKPNDKDIEALNELLMVLERSHASKIEDNIIYAKILCLHIKDRYLNSNQDINETLKFLSKDLKESLDFHIETLANKIISTQIVNYVKTLTIDVPDSELNNPIALANIENQFWDVHQKNILNEIIFSNSSENVKKNFFITANEILNNENYKK